MTPPLRAGVIGLGMMGRHHVRVLRALEEVELVGVVDPYGDRYGVADGLPMFDTLEPLLEDGVDMAVVAVPTDEHEKIGLLLAEAGVHTLIEKPLAHDSVAAQRLVDAFADAGLVGCVGHIERFNPALLALRRKLEAGELGEIYQIATRRQGPFPDRVRDVGVVKDLATHDIDLTAWVAEQPFVRIAAGTAHQAGRPHEDVVSIVGHLADGTVTNHLVNWLTPFKERITVVTGERGSFVADTLLADLTFYENAKVATQWETLAKFRGVSEGDMIRFAIEKPEPLVVELAGFRDAILDRGTRVVSLREGLAVVRVAEAVLRAAAEDRVVDLEPPAG